MTDKTKDKVVQMPNGAGETSGSLALQSTIPTPVLPDPSQLGAIQTLARGVAFSGLVRTTAPRGSDQAAADALFIMMMGFELGISPMTALNTIYVVKGRPTTSGQAMLSLMKRAGVKVEMPDVGKIKDSVTIKIKRRDSDDWMEFTYTEQMAKEAGLLGKDNWKGHKREMLLWRAVATAGRFGCPDIIGGLYTIEEMQPDVAVNEAGDVISYDDIMKQGHQKPGGEKNNRGSSEVGLTKNEALQLSDMAKDWGYDADKLFEALSNAQSDKPAITRLSEWPGTLLQARAAVIAHYLDYDRKAIESYTGKQGDSDTWVMIYDEAVKICDIAMHGAQPAAPGKTEDKEAGNKQPETKNQAENTDESEDKKQDNTFTWTDFDKHAIGDYAYNLGWDEDEALKMLHVEQWDDLPSRDTAERELRKIAIATTSLLRFKRVTYEGQYTVAHINHASHYPINVRLYGRDHFRDIAKRGGSKTDWSLVEDWQKGESYDLPERLRINPREWEVKENYIIAQKGSVTQDNIPF